MIEWRERNTFSGGDKQIRSILNQCRIPPRYQRAEISDFQDMKFQQESSYYIHGTPGSGKTHLLCAMLIDRALSRFDKRMSLFFPVEEMLDLIRSEYDTSTSRTREDWDSFDHLLTQLIEVPILAIDDLGSERLSEWVFSKLYQIINHRYNHLKITYITSQFDLDGLAIRFSDTRVSSRLFQMCEVISLSGNDRRVNVISPD
jgi:DNA replication protein DnaC